MYSSTCILFIHRGDSWYLPLALKQAVSSNPDHRIVLLGDYSNAKYSSIVEYHPISEYYNSAGKFDSIYTHLSTATVEYERFCFDRWFVWRDFMEANNIGRAMLPDTDVLLLSDIEHYLEYIDNQQNVIMGGGRNPYGICIY